MIKFIELSNFEKYKNGLVHKIFICLPVYTFICIYNNRDCEFECPVEKIDDDWFVKSSKTLQLHNIKDINENQMIDDDLPLGSFPSNALVRNKFFNDRYKI